MVMQWELLFSKQIKITIIKHCGQPYIPQSILSNKNREEIVYIYMQTENSHALNLHQ